MNILYLTSADLYDVGAAANHVKGFVSALSGDHFVRLVGARRSVRKTALSAGAAEIDTVWFPGFRGGWRYCERAFAVIASRESRRGFDLIYLRMNPSPAISAALRRAPQFKVLELNGLEIADHPAFHDMLECADLVLVASPTAARNLCCAFPSVALRVACHSNIGVNEDVFHPDDKLACRARLRLPPCEFLILHVSGFQKHHDFRCLLAALNEVTRCGIDARLACVGDGPRRGEVEGHAAELGLSDRVHFAGPVSSRALQVFISAADVCVNPVTAAKIAECGNLNSQKTLEYILCGRPVIESCDLTLPTPGWARGCVRCVAAGSVELFARELLSVLLDLEASTARAVAARGVVADQYSWTAVARETMRLTMLRMRGGRRVSANGVARGM